VQRGIRSQYEVHIDAGADQRRLAARIPDIAVIDAGLVEGHERDDRGACLGGRKHEHHAESRQHTAYEPGERTLLRFHGSPPIGVLDACQGVLGSCKQDACYLHKRQDFKGFFAIPGDEA
jgi:hypothetical protein